MTDYIGYDGLTQAAMRGVVREALKVTKANGASLGDHHFYITFRTKSPGVKMAEYLVERFPEDMTIVVQHQYWDLEVDDEHFEIVLKFSGVPQHLYVPFTAVSRFVDPSVNFMLTFESGESSIIAPTKTSEAKEIETHETDDASSEGTVVNLDAFRRNK